MIHWPELGPIPNPEPLIGNEWDYPSTSGSQLEVSLPPRDIWPCLETFGCHSGGSATGISLIEARDAGKHPTMHRTVPHNRELWPKMLIMPRLENPALDSSGLPLGWGPFLPKHIAYPRWTGAECTLGLSHSPCQQDSQVPRSHPGPPSLHNSLEGSPTQAPLWSFLSGFCSNSKSFIKDFNLIKLQEAS